MEFKQYTQEEKAAIMATWQFKVKMAAVVLMILLFIAALVLTSLEFINYGK